MTAEEIKEHRKKCTCVDEMNDTMCAKCQEEHGMELREIEQQDNKNAI